MHTISAQFFRLYCAILVLAVLFSGAASTVSFSAEPDASASNPAAGESDSGIPYTGGIVIERRDPGPGIPGDAFRYMMPDAFGGRSNPLNIDNMPISRPDSTIDYKILVSRLDPSVDYKILETGPDTPPRIVMERKPGE